MYVTDRTSVQADKASSVFTAHKDRHGNPLPEPADLRPTSLLQVAMNYDRARKREIEYRQSAEYKAVCIMLSGGMYIYVCMCRLSWSDWCRPRCTSSAAPPSRPRTTSGRTSGVRTPYIYG